MRGLAILEKAHGPDHRDVAASLSNLALLNVAQRQYAQAETLLKRALVITEAALGPNHRDTGANLQNLGMAYYNQGQFAQAEPLLKRSLSIWEKALGSDHPNVAIILNNLALLYQGQGQFAQAMPLFKRALTIRETVLSPNHPDMANSVFNLAALYHDHGKPAQAELLYKQALAIYEKSLAPDHPNMASVLNHLGLAYLAQGENTLALSSIRRASYIYRYRVVRGGTGNAAVREASVNRPGFFAHLRLLERNPFKESDAKIADEALQITQLAQASSTASALAKMAARFVNGSGPLANLIKFKQDAADRVIKQQDRLAAALGKPNQERNARHEQQLNDDIDAAAKETVAVDAELTRRFPEYQELTRSEPVTVKEVQALLAPGEAMLAYAMVESKKDPAYLWVVSKDAARFIRLSVDVSALAAQVKEVRNGVVSPQPVNNAAVLHEIYKGVFAPALPHLAGIKHVIVVPAGPLQSLPFNMLVTSPPPDIKKSEDYRQVDWLIKRYALSVLPSVSSLQALRLFTRAAGAQRPFAGFGDPLIGNASSGDKRGAVAFADVFRSSKRDASAAPAGLQSSEIADVEFIRGQDRLPETADELRAMGKILQGSPDAIWLQDKATESTLKRTDLAHSRPLLSQLTA